VSAPLIVRPPDQNCEAIESHTYTYIYLFFPLYFTEGSGEAHAYIVLLIATHLLRGWAAVIDWCESNHSGARLGGLSHLVTCLN
jgi:hypothetical protein